MANNIVLLNYRKHKEPKITALFGFILLFFIQSGVFIYSELNMSFITKLKYIFCFVLFQLFYFFIRYRLSITVKKWVVLSFYYSTIFNLGCTFIIIFTPIFIIIYLLYPYLFFFFFIFILFFFMVAYIYTQKINIEDVINLSFNVWVENRE
ncbi:hypothetical protein RO21_04405 [[Actinobacillus] muris]|uniref:Uncharacterized protein n=1 Tax=Muribacter muris TaxID=67855 RepID=A0A0J5P6B3_9PAST|nr:hypothetical protein RO21_04405 [[Actinobacillus] muris] [Muribacter muris]